LPGTEEFVLKNSYNGEKMDLSWFPIVTTCLSAVGILIGGLWIVQPIVDEAGWLAGKLAFLPIFFFRLFAWQIIIITLESFSFIPFVFFICGNFLVLYFAQNQIMLEPISSACLSTVFPMYKLPSQNLDTKPSLKILFWLVLTGNINLFISYALIFLLHHYDNYNPWCSEGPGVYFINILKAAFTNESVFLSTYSQAIAKSNYFGLTIASKSITNM
jgi:hypothetical protein